MTGPSDFTLAQQLAVSRALPRIARLIDRELARAGAPRMPWSLFTWGGHRSQYVSNTARADARPAIAETLARWEELSDTPFDRELSS